MLADVGGDVGAGPEAMVGDTFPPASDGNDRVPSHGGISAHANDAEDVALCTETPEATQSTGVRPPHLRIVTSSPLRSSAHASALLCPPEQLSRPADYYTTSSPGAVNARTSNRRSIIWTAPSAILARARNSLSPNASPRLRPSNGQKTGTNDTNASADSTQQYASAVAAVQETGDDECSIRAQRMPSPEPRSLSTAPSVSPDPSLEVQHQAPPEPAHGGTAMHLAVQITRKIRRVFSANNVRERAHSSAADFRKPGHDAPPVPTLPGLSYDALDLPIPSMNPKHHRSPVTRPSGLRLELGVPHYSTTEPVSAVKPTQRMRNFSDPTMAISPISAHYPCNPTLEVSSAAEWASRATERDLPVTPLTPQTPMVLPDDPILLRKVLHIREPTTELSVGDGVDDPLWPSCGVEFAAESLPSVSAPPSVPAKSSHRRKTGKKEASAMNGNAPVGSGRWINRMLRFGASASITVPGPEVPADVSRRYMLDDGTEDDDTCDDSEAIEHLPKKPAVSVVPVPRRSILKVPSASLEPGQHDKSFGRVDLVDIRGGVCQSQQARNRASTVAVPSTATTSPVSPKNMATAGGEKGLSVDDSLGLRPHLSRDTTGSVRSERSATVSVSTAPKRFRFNEQVLVGETWAKMEYDRRADNTLRLTPQLAMQIKQELNEFKILEMAVHEDSRHNTHLLA